MSTSKWPGQYIHDINPTEGVNGMEPIGLTASTSGAASAFSGLVIEHNLFDKINLPKDAELVGAKTSGIVFQYNTVINSGAQCYLNAPRQAAKFELRSNWFENNARSDFAHLFSKDSIAVGNRFVGNQDLSIAAGDFYWNGTNDSGYPAAENTRIVGNRLEKGKILVGWFWSSDKSVVGAKNNNLWAKKRDAGGDAHALVSGQQSGTTFKEDAMTYKPAVKLSSKDVGTGAPDPYCSNN